MSSALTLLPSSWRNRFSSRMRRLYGRRLRVTPFFFERAQAVDLIGPIAGLQLRMAAKTIY